MKNVSCMYAIAIIVFSFAVATGGAQKALSASGTFYRTLTVGSYGEDVRELQRMLNSDASTRIAVSGLGSPGQETAYFGRLTEQAVIRFQEKYAQDILYPLGLSSGTGVVGPSTIRYLSTTAGGSVATIPVSVTGQASVAAAPSSVPISTPSSVMASSTNPNLNNLDVFLDSIDRVGAKQNVPASTLSTIKSQVIKEVATTTNLQEAFLRSLPPGSIHSASGDSMIGKALATIERAFDRVFRPERARAAAGTPFGGALAFSFFCTCSDTWLLTVQPLPPTYVSLLSYVPYTQVYLSYNIPRTSWLLGQYEQGSGECAIYYGYGCLTIPTEGMVSPMVGSSPK